MLCVLTSCTLLFLSVAGNWHCLIIHHVFYTKSNKANTLALLALALCVFRQYIFFALSIFGKYLIIWCDLTKILNIRMTRICCVLYFSAVQRQNAVYAYFTSEQILHFAIAEQSFRTASIRYLPKLGIMLSQCRGLFIHSLHITALNMSDVCMFSLYQLL